MSKVLKPCPFCKATMRIQSNRDWHRLVGEHDEKCVFTDSETMMVPATDEQLALVIEDWNRRSQSAEADGVRDYLAEFAEGEVEAKTAIEELQDALSDVTAERDQLSAELRKAPPEWANMDPVLVVEHIRHATAFDADKVEAMLDFAIGAAMAAKEG